MARCLQQNYNHVTLIISGLCKSAGTLFAIGAHELVFATYGELGPLDVQLRKEDQLSDLKSGLNISEALQTLEQRALEAYLELIGAQIHASGGIVSFKSASEAASKVIGSIYGPVFSQIDPDDVGDRTRSMRIATEYGARLNSVSNNLKDDALATLTQKYPSHGFVIDFAEASILFDRVRLVTDDERELIEALGSSARLPAAGDPKILYVGGRKDDEAQERKSVSKGRRTKPSAEGSSPEHQAGTTKAGSNGQEAGP